MASVFDGAIKINRRVKDPITDDTLPSPGSLNWKQITSSSALSGTTGVDCMLVHGDRWKEMKGSLTENYTNDKKITVKGRHNETISGNRDITVQSDVTHTVSGGQTDRISQSHQAQVGMNYEMKAGQNVQQKAGMNIEQQAGMKHSVQATMVENNASATANNTAGAMMTIQGALVKINC
jgi:hypothetical protein